MAVMPPVLRDLMLLIVTFVGVTAVACAAGAANLGTAATLGQIAFAAVLVFLLLRR
jgi:ABC-type methionine transport system permease subunit